DDDVVLRHAVGGQAGGEVVEAAVDALDRRRPRVAAVDAHLLRDADALARFERTDHGGQRAAHRAGRGGQRRFAHSTSPCPGTPPSPWTTKVMRDRLGSSVSPTARLSMLKAREASMPEMWASTPGWLCTSADRTCRMPILSASRRAASRRT